MPTDRSGGLDRPQLWAVFGATISALALVATVLALIWPGFRGGDGDAAESPTSITIFQTPLPTAEPPAPGTEPPTTKSPGTSSPTVTPTADEPTPRAAETVIRIEIVQPDSGGGSGPAQLLVSFLTALGAFLAGVGALAALRRTSPAAGERAAPPLGGQPPAVPPDDQKPAPPPGG